MEAVKILEKEGLIYKDNGIWRVGVHGDSNINDIINKLIEEL